MASFSVVHALLLALRLHLSYFQQTNVTSSDRNYSLEVLSRNVTNVLDSLFDNYDKNMRADFEGPPLKVVIDISVLSLGPVSEQDMELSFDCYFRQYWQDKRLQYNIPNVGELSLNAVMMLNSIWKPDTYIRNGKRSYLHKLTVPNKLLRLRSNGSILLSQRLTIKTYCPMHLRKFPMDIQACPIEIGSMGYNKDEMYYEWGVLKLDPKEVELSQYKLIGVLRSQRNAGARYGHGVVEHSTLVAHFKLERQQGYYILQIYAPCMIVVSLSWVSFWINKEASPARVTLGVMTVLTMSTLELGGSSYRSNLPKVSYTTALDLYIVVCFGFVFIALVEYAVINFAYIVYIKKMVQKTVEDMTDTVADQLDKYDSMALDMAKDDGDEGDPFGNIESEADPLYFGILGGDAQPRGSIASSASYELRKRRKVNDASAGQDAKERTAAGNRKLQSVRQRWHKIKEETSSVVDRIDDIAKILFPFSYFVFNCFYWMSYLFWLPDEIDESLTQEYGSPNKYLELG